jgi:pilus assembly protein CpaB
MDYRGAPCSEVLPVRLRTVLVFLAAVVFGVIAVVAARFWLEGERTRLAGELQSMPENTIVVATRALRYGDLLQNQNLKEIPWPGGAQIPAGSFRTRDEVLKGGERYVMSAIETDEPLLAWKITGPGQRATLSAALTEGMKAVTIRVDDILGVAGFVLPGDRVDILLTRSGDDQTFVDVLLQGVKVLAIDQIADDRRDKPAVVRAVTFEVTTQEAQKLTLAATIGKLSLALRNVASAQAQQYRRVTVKDLTSGEVAANLESKKAEDQQPKIQPVAAPTRPPGVSVGVVRNFKRAEYRVRQDGT